MKVHELIDILQGFYPDEEVVCHPRMGGILQILGIDRENTEKNGNCTLDVDWSMVLKRVVETEVDKTKRQRDELTKKIEEMERIEAEVKAKEQAKEKTATRKKRTTTCKKRPTKRPTTTKKLN